MDYSSLLTLHPKVTAATAAGAAVLVIVWVLSLYGITAPGPVEGALVLLLTFAGGYFAPADVK